MNLIFVAVDSYADLIKGFKWRQKKFSISKPLVETIERLTSLMNQNDVKAKKYYDNLIALRQKVGRLERKPGANLNQRDFTDEVYEQSDKTRDVFVKSEMFCNLLVILSNDRVDAFKEEMPKMLEEYYVAADGQEERKLKDNALHVLEERLANMEKRNKEEEAKAEIQEETDGLTFGNWTFKSGTKSADIPDHVVEALDSDNWQALKKKQKNRIPAGVVPDALLDLGISDKEGNKVYRIVCVRDQAEDFLKVCRRKQLTARVFDYNFEEWKKEKEELTLLKEQLKNDQANCNLIATTSMAEVFSALMHLKVIRAYVEGVLRFGIGKEMFLGVIIPRKGQEREILKEMTEVLAEDDLKEMYGEKMDANEAEDYWPFVSIPLTSPMFLVQKD